MKRARNNVEYYELINKSDDQDGNSGAIYNPPLVETVINEGDTLQSISIKFHCPVAELKRINNIHRENEIFARRTIKVPFRPFSMVHKSGDSSPNSITLKKSINPIDLKQKLADVTITEAKLVDIDDETGNIENRLSNKNSLLVNEIIFNTKISETNSLNSLQDNNNIDDLNDDDDEEIQLLPQTSEIRRIGNEKYCDWDCSGSDWGLSWPILLAIVLILSFIGPLIYVFYIYEHPEEFHHHHS